jgi:hypothetical protein
VGRDVTLGGVLIARRRARFVGRGAERRLFDAALEADEPPFAVLNVYGPGGIGKTSLLDRFEESGQRTQALVIRLDGRDLAPTPDAVLDAISARVRVPDHGPIPAPAQGRLVLLLDTFEMLAPLDDWLRTGLIPRLPATALTVVSGRVPLGSAWRADPAWRDLLRRVPLRNLDPNETCAYLQACGIDNALHGRIARITHGHPLGLSLVADVVASGGETVDAPLSPDLVATLVRQFVDIVPSPRHRRALEVCAVARVTTQALLRDVVGAEEAEELFEWLCDLSFIDSGPEGVFPHDLARDALEADLRWRDPDAYARVFRGVRDHVFGRLRSARGREQQRALFDEKFLLRHQPDLMQRLEWSSFGAYFPEPATSRDVAAFLELCRLWEGPQSVTAARRWWERQPETFSVVRRPTGEVRGFNAIVDLTRSEPAELDADPIARVIWQHIQRQAPPRSGEVVLLSRFAIDQDVYQGPSPTVNLAVVLSIQAFLTTPNLSWWFVCLADPDTWDDYFTFSALPRAVGADTEVGGRRFGFFGNDFRAIPVDAWLELLTERALARDYHPANAAAQTSPLLVLSRQEFEEAVRRALRDLHRPQALAGNPLLRSALVRGRLGGTEPTAQQLVDLLHQAADRLRDDPRDQRLHRVLDRTYLRPAPTQERAAEVLDLPMSTYKRSLRRAIERIVDLLWQLEIDATLPGGP